MKKKIYLQPVTDIIEIQPLQLMDASRGWSKDGNPPINVEKEEEAKENNPSSSIWDQDGFLDLD